MTRRGAGRVFTCKSFICMFQIESPLKRIFPEESSWFFNPYYITLFANFILFESFYAKKFTQKKSAFFIIREWERIICECWVKFHIWVFPVIFKWIYWVYEIPICMCIAFYSYVCTLQQYEMKLNISRTGISRVCSQFM